MAKKDKTPVTSRGMRANTYALLSRCIEEGLAWMWTHAHKHTAHPTREQMLECGEQDIMNEICQWFDFEPFDE